MHIISAAGEERRGLEYGAVAVLTKPVEQDELDERARRDPAASSSGGSSGCWWSRTTRCSAQSIIELIGNGDVETTAVGSGEEALEALEQEPFDCMVLDLKLPGMSGLELMRQIKETPALAPHCRSSSTPARSCRATRRRGCAQLAETVIVKDVRSPERLLDETALFLHRVEARLPERKRKMLRSARRRPTRRSPGKKVLVVDDDVRNIFALTALLEQHQMERASTPRTASEALEQLEPATGIDVVLMDIMMPEMDGYEAMRRIRERPRLSRRCRSSR